MCYLLGLALFLIIVYYVFGWGGVVLLGLIAVVGILIINFNEKEKEEERIKREEENKKRIEEEKQQEQKRKEELDGLYGTCVKEIKKTYSLSEFKNPIYVYEDSKIIILNDEPIKFSDIISYSVSDDKYIKKDNMTVTTKTDTGSMIGRAIVGDIVAGPAGAVIGGATAKKDSVIKQGNEKTVHDFTVLVNLNSLARPIIRVHFGEDGKCVNEFTSILNIIVRNNNK